MKNAPHHLKLQRPLSAALATVLLGTALLTPPLAYAQTQAQKRESRFKGEAVTLNFVNADIEGVSRAMGAILKQQFVVDPRVKGNITLFSEEPLSPREAYLNFLAALRGLGFTVVESGGLFKVVPEADAKLQSSTVSVGAVSRQGDQVLTQIFKLSHENANNLVPVLRPLISPNNTINANPGNNTLVVTDYADNLARIAKIIAAMDTPSAGDVEIIPLKYAVASDLATLVQRLSDGGNASTPGVPGVSAATSSVLVDTRSNALIVRASTPARMASIKTIVEKLDRPTTGDNPMGNIYVVYLKNADATRLATVLRAAFSANSSNAAAGGGGGGGVSTPAAPQQTANVGIGGQAANASQSAAASPINAVAAPSTGGMIQADPATNSLIITAPEPVYRQLRAVIDQLDSRRAQVYVESLIVEVDPSQTASFGIQWQGLLGNKGDTNVIGGGTNFGSGLNNILTASAALAKGSSGVIGAVAEAGLPNPGFNIGVAHKIGNYYTLGALAQALSSTTGTNILSTPNLVTLDNEEAKIVVGQNVPFITGSFTNTGSSTSNPFQTIERKDVGITLKIKPQIGENGTVRMTIFQESSSVATTTAVGTDNAGPTTNKRSIDSTIVVDDGQIIVLGGLIEDTYTTTRNKVPLLGDIPFLGALFRNESRERKKTNLMVFLRPVVMRDQAASNRVSIDRYDYIRGEQLNSQPPSSSVLGINESPVLPPIRPQQPTPNGVPPPLTDPSPPPRNLVPSTPAPAAPAGSAPSN